jgi:hypothetical protein
MGLQIIQAGRMLVDLLAIGAAAGTAGDGYVYIGNTPEFSLSRAVETTEHYDSDGAGLKQKDQSIDVQNTFTGSFTTDHVSVENLAMWMGTDVNTRAISAGTAVTQNATVKKGRFVVLGESLANVGGVGAVTSVSVTKAGTTIPATDNYVLDAARGTIYWNPASSALADADAVVITYSNASKTIKTTGTTTRTLYGRVRFEGASRGGSAIPKDAFLPYAKITASGDLAMKGDQWMSMQFALEALSPASGQIPVEIRDGSLTGFVG